MQSTTLHPATRKRKIWYMLTDTPPGGYIANIIYANIHTKTPPGDRKTPVYNCVIIQIAE